MLDTTHSFLCDDPTDYGAEQGTDYLAGARGILAASALVIPFWALVIFAIYALV